MAKRKKKARKIVKKQNPMKAKLPTSFDCPFCNHEGAVECKMERTKNLANLNCLVCGAHYKMTTTTLMEPVDCFCAWIDKCKEEQQKAQQLEEEEGAVAEGENDEDFEEGEDLEEEEEQENQNASKRQKTDALEPVFDQQEEESDENEEGFYGEDPATSKAPSK